MLFESMEILMCVCVHACMHFVRWCKFVSVSASPEPVYKPPKNSQWITLYFIYPFQLSNPLWWNLWKSWLSLDITGLKDITLFCWNIRDWTKSEPRQCRGCSWKANTPSFPTPVAVFAVFTAVDLTECIVIQSMLATPSDLSLEVWPIVNCTWLSVTERATSITNSEASKLPWPQVVGIQPSLLQVPLISQHQWRRSSTRSTWPTNCYCTLSPHWWTGSSVNSDPPAEGFSQVKVKSRETVLGGWISARLSARISSLHRWALRKVLFLGVWWRRVCHQQAQSVFRLPVCRWDEPYCILARRTSPGWSGWVLWLRRRSLPAYGMWTETVSGTQFTTQSI